MVYSFVLLADMELSERLYQSLVLAFVGMLVVFLALVVTALAIVVLNSFFGSVTTQQASHRKNDGMDDARLKAVIAAAATMALGRKVNITQIQPAQSPSPGTG